MKRQTTTYILGLMALVLTLVGAGLFWNYHRSTRVQSPQALNEAKLSELINEFRINNEAMFRIDVPLGIDPKRPRELVDPISLFPQWDEQTRAQLAEIIKAGEACLSQNSLSHSSLQKLQLWYDSKCKKTQQINDSFWKTAPLIHPLGGSWTYWLFKQGYGDQNWLREQSEFLHILELRHADLTNPAPLQKIINELSPDETRRLLKGAGLILTPTHVLLGSYFWTDHSAMLGFSRPQWEEFVKKNGLIITEHVSQNCMTEKLSYCWDFAMKPIPQVDPKPILMTLLAGLISLFAIVCYVLWKRSSERDQFIENQQLLMQTLAHELRTPVASLNLNLEAIRPHFDELPEDTKSDFLRIAATSDKMNRIIHFSRQYLAVLRSEGQFKVLPIANESYNDLIAACLEDHTGNFEFAPLTKDVGALLDPYWFAVCVDVLLTNAQNHGKDPITIGCAQEGQDLLFWVQDSGDNPDLKLSTLISPQSKASAKGFGLGLSLIHRIIIQSKGVLSLTLQPTRFLIRFQGAAIGKDTSR